MIFLAAALALLAGHSGVENIVSLIPSADSVVIVMLGTGTPVPNPHAAGAATAIIVGHRVFLFDAGSNVERQLAAAQLPTDGVEAVFFTHLHSDHTLGYADLIFTSWVFGRHNALRAFGPPGLRAMTSHLIAAFADDIDARTSGLEHAPRNGYRVDARETRGGLVYDSAGVRISAFRVSHGVFKVALGYRIVANGRTIVISGDTKPSDEVARQSKNADVLVHEVYSASKTDPKEKMADGGDWATYLASAHTSDVEVGRIAAQANPRMVVLTHIISQGATDDELIAGVHAGGYKGRVVVAHDLDRY
jgi:ribonuclease BN (tRNA processing enzyme)